MNAVPLHSLHQFACQCLLCSKQAASLCVAPLHLTVLALFVTFLVKGATVDEITCHICQIEVTRAVSPNINMTVMWPC